MISIYERIENLAIDSKNNTFSTIAKQILNDFNEGVFKIQQDLADVCFVSMSTITQFSKSALCEGYKELSIRLKIEYENRLLVKPPVSTSDSDKLSLEVFELINECVIDSKDFILNLAREINQSKKIWLAPSSQALPAMRNLQDILFNQGIEALLMDSSTNLEIARHFDFKNELIFLIITGRDTLTLQRILEFLVKLSNRVFIITTSNHIDEIPKIEEWNVLNLNLGRFVDYKYKVQAWSTLFFLLSEKIDNKPTMM